MRTPEFIKRCMAAGMSLEMALTAAQAFEAECELAVAEVLEARRAKERVRQAKHRALKNECHAVSRDKTLEPVLERDLTGERSRVVTPSLPSLRSEEVKTPTEPNGSVAPKGAKPRTSKRAPESWSPSASTMLTLVTEGHKAGDLERALTRMRDYEYSRPHTDWDACFRTWVRKDADRKPRHERPHPDQRATAYAERLGDIGAAMEAALQQRGGSG